MTVYGPLPALSTCTWNAPTVMVSVGDVAACAVSVANNKAVAARRFLTILLAWRNGMMACLMTQLSSLATNRRDRGQAAKRATWTAYGVMRFNRSADQSRSTEIIATAVAPCCCA